MTPATASHQVRAKSDPPPMDAGSDLDVGNFDAGETL